MNDLVIIGAGGHGRVILDLARSLETYEHIYFLDDDSSKWGMEMNEARIMAQVKYLEEIKDRTHIHCVLAIGDNQTRLKMYAYIKSLGYEIPVLIHPTAWVSPWASISEGAVIMAQSVVQANTTIGIGSIVNTGSIVEHDCYLEMGVHLSPGVKLGGNVRVGKATWMGIGAVAVHNTSIGSHVVVAAGAVVTKDIESHVMVAGVPASIKKRG